MQKKTKNKKEHTSPSPLFSPQNRRYPFPKNQNPPTNQHNTPTGVFIYTQKQQLKAPVAHAQKKKNRLVAGFAHTNKMVPPRMLLLACVAVSVSGHGYVESPPSRNYGCRSGLNSGCGSVQYEPQSVEGPDGWPSGGPADGTVAAAGRSGFGQLNAQTPSRWGKTAISSGRNVFTWRFTAVHRTRDYKYYITRAGWNQNSPLGTSSFDTTPFCVVDGGMQMPSNPTSHSCTVPTRSGYHVVLAVWDVGDTGASFYNAIDVTIGGAGPTPPGPVPVPPPTPTRPVPTPPTPPTPTVPVPTPPSGGCSGGAGVALWGNCRAAPHCCASGATCYEQSDCFAQCKPSCSRADGWTCRVLGADAGPTPPTPPAPVPVPPTPPRPVPVPAPTPPASGCGRAIRKWNRCLGMESCCAAGLSCTGTRWWKSCK